VIRPVASTASRRAVPRRSPLRRHTLPESPSGNNLPTRRDIERMREQIEASKKSVIWTDRSDVVLSQRITDDLPLLCPEPPRKHIILDHQPIDITLPPHAAPLISTTALVQDYVDVPHSLSFML
jgi:hypothetical protein